MTWKCPLCEDGYGSEVELREHLLDSHDENPDDFELKVRH